MVVGADKNLDFPRGRKEPLCIQENKNERFIAKIIHRRKERLFT